MARNQPWVRLVTVEPAMLNIDKPWWVEQAACRDADPAMFFPGPGRGNAAAAKQAKELCRTCPVVNECLAYAMGFSPRSLTGIWGGMTERERARQHKATHGLVYSHKPPTRH